ncbi:hypothetical protein ABPG74_001428 [Tetrahymena malaccensis]
MNYFAPDLRNGGGRVMFKKMREKHQECLKSMKPLVNSLQRPHSHIDAKYKSKKHQISFQMNEFQMVQKTFFTSRNIKSQIDTSQPKTLQKKPSIKSSMSLSEKEINRQHRLNCLHLTSAIIGFDNQISKKKQLLKMQNKQRELYFKNNSMNQSYSDLENSKLSSQQWKDESTNNYFTNDYSQSRSLNQSKYYQGDHKGNSAIYEEPIHISNNQSQDQISFSRISSPILKPFQKELKFLTQNQESKRISSEPSTTRNDNKVKPGKKNNNAKLDHNENKTQFSLLNLNSDQNQSFNMKFEQYNQNQSKKIQQRPYSAFNNRQDMIVITENEEYMPQYDEQQSKSFQLNKRDSNIKPNLDKKENPENISKISINSLTSSNYNLTLQNQSNLQNQSKNQSNSNKSFKTVQIQANSYWGGAQYIPKKNPYIEQQKREDINYDFKQIMLNQVYAKLQQKVKKLPHLDTEQLETGNLRRYLLNLIIDYSLYSELEIQALAKIVYNHFKTIDKLKLIECSKSLSKDLLKNSQQGQKFTKKYFSENSQNGNLENTNEDLTQNNTNNTNESSPKINNKKIQNHYNLKDKFENCYFYKNHQSNLAK